jgi:hypothetical protein
VCTNFVDLSSNRALVLLVGHDTLGNAAVGATAVVAVAFVNGTLKSRAVPTHVEVTVIHRTSSITIREATREES